MKTLLKKMDYIAGRWLNSMDSQLQQPIVQAVTGEVFTHGTSLNGHEGHEPQQPANNSDHEPRLVDNQVGCPPELRKANALSNR